MTERAASACRCCGRGQEPETSWATVSRRTLLAAGISLPLLGSGSGAAWALQPGVVSGARRPGDWVGPSYARGMASDVTSALVSLVQAYGSIANQIGDQQKRQRDLADKLAAAVRDKAAKLAEYRDGQFCSGCNQTRSEILAKGEQFPHPGQRIIKPTEEQIARKERELQGVIDRLAEELKKARAKLAELDPQLTEIKNQLFAGMGLWRTANVFERRLIRQEDAYDVEDYVARRANITRSLTQSQKEATAAQGAPALRNAVVDLESAMAQLRQAESERLTDLERVAAAMESNVTTAREQIMRVDNEAKAQASRITAFGLDGYLRILTVPMAPNIDPRPLVPETAGYNFRMGRYSREGWGEILPRVAEFIGRARNLQTTFPRGAPLSANVELSRAESTLGRLKSRLAAAEQEEQRLAAIEAEKRRQAAAERQRMADQNASEPTTN